MPITVPPAVLDGAGLTRVSTTAFDGPCRSSQMRISSPLCSPENVSVRSFSVALKVKVFLVTLPSASGELWSLRVRVPVSVSPLTVTSRTSAAPPSVSPCHLPVIVDWAPAMAVQASRMAVVKRVLSMSGLG